MTLASAKNSTANHHLFAWISLIIIPISGLSIDIYVPSLPALCQYFQVDKALVQLTITFYMIGVGLMQLLAGGITDSFGRRKPFLIAMSIYILATLCICFCNNIYLLLFLRFTQGVAVGAMLAPVRSIIPDLFQGIELQKMFNYMVMAWSIGPIIAPAFGGYLQSWFGWRANFYFLVIYSLIGFVLMLLYVPETSKHYHSFQFSKILQRNKDILLNRVYLSSLLVNATLYSILILFAVVGPFLIQEIMHFTAAQFGYIALIEGLFWFLGTMTNRFLIHTDLKRKSQICSWAMLATTLLMTYFAIFYPINIYLILAPLFIITWLGGILFPNYLARSVSLFPQFIGSANALFGSLIFLISGLGSALASFLKSNSQLPFALAYVFLMSACIVIQFLCRKQSGQVSV